MRKFFNQKSLNIVGLCIIFLIVFILNHFNGQIVDDLGYATVSNPLEHVWWEYFNWNGRAIGEFLAIGVLLKLPLILVDFLNTIAFMLLLWILEKFTETNESQTFSIWRYALLFASIMVFTVVPGQDFFWTTGSANYLYTALFALIPLLVVYNKFRFNLVSNKNILTVFAIPFGLLAGWSTENIGGTTLLGLILLMILMLCNKQRIDRVTFLLSISTLVGYLLLIFAPGNSVRANGASVHIKGNAIQLFTFATQNYFIFIVIYFMLLVLVIIRCVAKNWITSSNKLLVGSVLFGVLAFADYFALMLSPITVAPRSHIGFVLLLSVAVVIMINFLISDIEWRLFPILVIVLISVEFIVQLVPGIFNTQENSQELVNRYNYIVNQKKAGNEYPVVSAVDYNKMSKFYGGYQLWDVTPGANAQFTKDVYNNFFGLKNIYSVSPELWNIFYKYANPLLLNEQQEKNYTHRLQKQNLSYVKFGLHNDGTAMVEDSKLSDLKIKHYGEEVEANVSGNTIAIRGTDITLTHDSITKKFSKNTMNYLVIDKSNDHILDLVSFDDGIAHRGE